MYNIKTKFNVVCYIALLFTCFACDDSFLDKGPLDQVAPSSFFKTKDDLGLYVNDYYRYLPSHGVGSWNPGLFDDDAGTDISIRGGASSIFNGSRTVPGSGGGYDWAKIRSTNYFFSILSKGDIDFTKSTDEDTKQYIGEAYFFRAWFYFDLLKQFGDLPWIDKPLKPDIKELALERISRKTIAENILKDLDKAIANMKDGTAGAYKRINKQIAMLFKARVALYEGTWERYHARENTPFKVAGSDGRSFIEIARDEAKKIIDSNIYSLHKYNDDAEGAGYFKLFNRLDYSDNTGVLLWAKYDVNKGMVHNLNRYIKHGSGAQLTKQLVDSYLMQNGKTITESGSGYGGEIGFYTPTDKSSNYEKRFNLFKNRDPRLVQIVMHQGQVNQTQRPNRDPDLLYRRHSLGTGFVCIKGMRTEDSQSYTGNIGTLAAMSFRYAEVLLIYAEAQAELGNNTEAIAAIDKIRERAGMTKLSAHMPAGSNVLAEVRRERKVELALEGYRWDDIFRWAEAHKLQGFQPKGVQFTNNPDLVKQYKKGYKAIIDVNGKRVDQGLQQDEDQNILVDAQGFTMPYKNALENGYIFDKAIDYLKPINQRDINLSEGKLKQNPGWDARK